MEAQQYVASLVQAGMTQVEISRRTEIPQPTISKVLRGEVSDVLSRNYRRLQALHAEVFPLAGAMKKEESAGSQDGVQHAV